MEEFLRMLAKFYVNDKLAPGVSLAWLSEQRTWYCSVKRYVTRREAVRCNGTVLVQVKTKVSAAHAVRLAILQWRAEFGKLGGAPLDLEQEFAAGVYEFDDDMFDDIHT